MESQNPSSVKLLEGRVDFLFLEILTNLDIPIEQYFNICHGWQVEMCYKAHGETMLMYCFINMS